MDKDKVSTWLKYVYKILGYVIAYLGGAATTGCVSFPRVTLF